MSTPAPAAPGAGVRPRDRWRSPAALLNLAGVVLVAASFVPLRAARLEAAQLALGAAALLAWVVWVLVGAGRVRSAALLVGGVAAAAGAGLGSTSLIAPAVVALLVAVGDPDRPARLVGLLVGLVAVALLVAAAVRGLALTELLTLLAALAVGGLGGATRRQRRVSDARERELLAGALAAERQAERTRLLEERAASARDVHDVLAHALGGLVLQLDAIEALLEHGRIEEATERAAAARRLAGEGLAEARHAVAALRGAPTAGPAVPDDALAALVDEHERLGGALRLTGDPSLAGLGPAHREAVTAALREALVNARRHAPGEPVSLGVEQGDGAIVLRVENALPAVTIPSPGGGHGLAGMRERFAALGDGSSVRVDADRGVFALTATAVRP